MSRALRALCASVALLVVVAGVVVVRAWSRPPLARLTSAAAPRPVPLAVPTPAASLPLPTPVARLAVPPPCAEDATDLPAPSSTWVLKEQAHVGGVLSVVRGRVLFAEIPGTTDARLDSLDPATGDVRHLTGTDPMLGAQFVGGSAWVLGDLDLRRYDAGTGVLTGRWTPSRLAPRDRRPPTLLAVAVSPDTAYVVGTSGWRRLWVTAVDAGTGAVRWTRTLSREPLRSWDGSNGVAADRTGVYVGVSQPEPGVRLWRVDRAGRVRATRRLLVASDPDSTPELLAGADSLYVSFLKPVHARGQGGGLLRLDRQDLRVLAERDGPPTSRLSQGPSGLWAEGPTCGDELLAHLDARTLEADRAYRLPYAAVVTSDMAEQHPMLMVETTDGVRRGRLVLEVFASL